MVLATLASPLLQMTRETPTQYWNDSCAVDELAYAVERGATGATSNPSINNSPWTRGAPHNGFSRLIRLISSRRARSIFGRPARFRDFQRQNARKPALMPAQDGLWLHDLS